MQKMKLMYWRVVGVMLAVLVALLTVDLKAFAQTQPAPTPRPPSGSYPYAPTPTDVPVDWALLWVLVFFGSIAIGLVFANWLVRRGTFNEAEKI